MDRRIIKKIADLVFPPILRLKVLRYPDLPRDSGALIAVNHIHALDPVIISYVLYPTWLHHLAKVEIFRVPGVAQLVADLGAVPVDRRNPRADTAKKALDLLQKAKYVCIFPQGTRRKREFGELKKGVARLALAGDVPIYPAAITGLERVKFWGFIRRPEVKILFGDPISVAGKPNTKEGIDGLVAEVRAEMLKLYQQINLPETNL